jgi:hypothetical protein
MSLVIIQDLRSLKTLVVRNLKSVLIVNIFRCRQWVKFVGKEDLIYVPLEKLHTLKYVCGDHFENRAFNKKKNRLKKSAIPSKNLKADPLSDEMLLNFPSHVYSNIDVAMNVVSPVICDTEATKVKAIAGPSNSGNSFTLYGSGIS